MNSGPMPIYDLLIAHCSNRGDTVAAMDGTEQLSYQQLGNRVDQLAKALLASGVRKGDRVVTLAPPCIEFWIGLLATTAIGAVWSGLNPRYQKHEYQSHLQDLKASLVLVYSPYEERDYHQELLSIVGGQELECPPKVVVIGPALCEQHGSYAALISQGEAICEEEYARAREEVKGDDIAVIVYTSGSTGKPKGAMLSHGAMLRCAAASVKWLGSGLAKAIMAVPINHVGGLNNLCMNVFYYGGTIIFLKKFSIEAIAEIGEREGVTYVGHNQTTFTMLCDLPGFTMHRMRACKVLVHGGSRTSKSTLQKFQSLDAYIASVYAQTESCGYLLRSLPNACLDVMANTLGKPIEGVKIRVTDPITGDLLPQGEIGELQAKFDWAFSGYFNNEQATNEAFTSDNYLRTGDLCLIRSDGNVELIDRMKQMFKSGGHSIFPVEIEHAICTHPEVAMAAVLGVPHARFGKVGYAFVAPIKGSTISERELVDYLRLQIANFKIPKTIHLMEQLPILPNTKIDKQTLKDLFNDLS